MWKNMIGVKKKNKIYLQNEKIHLANLVCTYIIFIIYSHLYVPT